MAEIIPGRIARPVIAHATQEQLRQYKRDYERGWATSRRASEGALDRADDRNEPHAWYDGYHDYATDREKWHLLHCPDHNQCP